MKKEIKYDKNGDVKAPNQSMKRPESKVNETTEVQRFRRRKAASLNTESKSFNPVKDEKENNYINARRKRITRS